MSRHERQYIVLEIEQNPQPIYPVDRINVIAFARQRLLIAGAPLTRSSKDCSAI